MYHYCFMYIYRKIMFVNNFTKLPATLQLHTLTKTHLAISDFIHLTEFYIQVPFLTLKHYKPTLNIRHHQLHTLSLRKLHFYFNIVSHMSRNLVNVNFSWTIGFRTDYSVSSSRHIIIVVYVSV